MAPKIRQAPRRAGLAALACALHALALALPSWQLLAVLFGFAPVTTTTSLAHPLNWTGQVAALLVSVLFIYRLRWGRPAVADLHRPQPGSLRATGVVVGLIVLAIFINAYLVRQASIALWWHERLFYTLVLGVEEELFYRGVLLGLLSPVFSRSIRLPGAYTSWGGLVSALLFGLGHIIKITPIHFVISDLLAGGHTANWPRWWLLPFYFPPAELLYPFAMGLFFLWVRERTGSVWVAAGTHCLCNAALVLGRSLA
ncbi:CPBP family intramembrane glutamic endopeptidase [Hymenobacter sp. BT559]|uniref:CPBP family intramembrane glutamic endopeptidase n=1 Tax=Hymenobacter sp. BT559 TaxID=2795729 RepID=UPI001AAD3BD6